MNVLVVGMPRSGTSMVTGIFARAGYFVTDEPDTDLRAGDENNPDGYWEAGSLVKRNVRLFESAGYPDHNTWLFDTIPDAVVERLDQMPPHRVDREFVATYEANAPWVWKDPRLCYTLRYWWKIVDPLTTRVVLATRDPDAIYRSFVRLGWRDDTPSSRADVFARIDGHLTAARAAIEALGIPALEVSYESFHQSPDQVAEAMATFFGLELEAGALGFDKRFDHSGLRGRFATWVDRTAGKLPPSLRAGIKRTTPRALMAAVFPERTE